MCGIDGNDDGKIDTVTERREFVFPQHGSPIPIDVEPRTNYVIEVAQLERGKLAGPAPDPGLSGEDLRYHPERSLLTARIHNVGSLPVRNIKIAFYDGNPDNSGKRISVKEIPNIEAPNDLEPRTVTVGVNYPIKGPTDIYIVIDPDGEIADEITTFNNVAHTRLTGAEVTEERPASKPAATPFPRGRGRGR